MKIKVSELRNYVKDIISEGVENGTLYFAVYDNNWKKPQNIAPVCVLTEQDINEDDAEIRVNGKWVFVSSEYTNFFADNSGNGLFCRPGDLVFESMGEHAIYRPGLNTVTGCEGMGGEVLIGTLPELKKYALEYAEEIKEWYGVDAPAIVRRW